MDNACEQRLPQTFILGQLQRPRFIHDPGQLEAKSLTFPTTARSLEPPFVTTTRLLFVSQVKWKDFATDLDLAPASFDAERVDDEGGMPFSMRLLKAVVPTNEVSQAD